MTASKNFPTAFENRVKNDPFLGEKLLSALNLDVPISIRYNKSKIAGDFLAQDSESKVSIPWTETAFYLKERPIFTLDPLFHAGVYYPQEAGSMMLEKVLKQLDLNENPVILDLCAAPGGKSTLIASFLDNKGLLVSNEVIHSRAKILKENLTKWGYSNTLVSNNDPKDFQRIKNFFDCIVIDAPCSGEGMFRKDLESRNEWSEANVDLCSGRQKRIVIDVWDSLKPGGYLIYSTCTFNSQENEENVAWFQENLACEVKKLDYEPFQNDRSNSGAYALPHLVDSEGFYIVVLQKEKTDFRPSKFKNTNRQIKQVKDTKFLSKFVNLSNKRILEWNAILFAIPEDFTLEVIELHEQLRLIKMGTELGTKIREELIPDHALALDAKINHFDQKVELSKDQALHYQKGEIFELKAEKGYNLLTFEGVNLGWIKHLGNRFNNLYPKEWRIRMKIE
jgi:16S rRNA C967 or C1407 C5-methylase (RsmB/RsmF family)/NOL1/NOP2/fmu family ribosome biogenesis protein